MLLHPSPVAGVSRHSAVASDHWLAVLAKFMDAALIVGVLLGTVGVYSSTWELKYTVAALLAALFFFAVAELSGLYRPWRGETLKRQFFQVLFVWAQAVLALLLLAYAFKASEAYSRVAVGVWLLATPLLLSGWRIVARRVVHRLASRPGARRRVVVWGAGESGDQLAQTIRQSPWLGLELTQYVRDEGAERTPAEHRRQSDFSCLERLELSAKQGDFDILYIALPITARERIAELLDRLADTTATVYMVPDYFTTSLFHGHWSSLEGIPLISVYETPFWGADGWLKRAEDLVLSSIILLVAAIPMLLIAAAVKLSSPGPVLFKQRRYGMDGREIVIWKFRTMRVCEDGPEVPQARRGDPRVTPLGALLRRTSLDELPQFINVLLGDMSIVGPRPHAVAHNELYRGQVKGYMLRHKVRPGITGWAQINGWRGETDTLEKMTKRIEHDLWYIRNWSLWLDLKIVMLTAINGFRGQNAY
jgi:putative colanic acid biosynthesis UDP-glucose lipid carrier transferase